MSNLLSVDCTYILNIHQLNILAVLKHRIRVAELQQNVQLLKLLEQEKNGIIPLSIRFNPSSQSVSQIESLFARFKLLRHGLIDFINKTMVNKAVAKTELQVKKLYDREGNEWWYAYDPKSGKSVYADSDLEMCRWIEAEYENF